MSELEPPYELIVQDLRDGKVVPFFGSAASAVCRSPDSTVWDVGEPFFPFGAELAANLERACSYSASKAAYDSALADLLKAVMEAAPGADTKQVTAAIEKVLRNHLGGPPGLALIASFLTHVQGDRDTLEARLHKAFDIDSKPGPLHAKLAAISEVKLYVTTNYDDLLEQALEKRCPHVLVDRLDKGLAIRSRDGTYEPIDRTGPDLERRLSDDPVNGQLSAPIIFKMHGSIDRKNGANDSYLITEEDYVDYLGRDHGNYIPPYINGLMQGKKILFLGYSLEDWNIRVILSKLLKPTKSGGVRCWAIVRGRSDAEQRLWQSHKLNIYSMDLHDFADRLVNELG